MKKLKLFHLVVLAAFLLVITLIISKFFGLFFINTEKIDALVMRSEIELLVKNKPDELSPDEKLWVTLTSKCDCRKNLEIKLAKKANFILAYSYHTVTRRLKKLATYNETEFAGRVLTCDFYNVMRRGENQKIIGFSLYGKKQHYYDKLNEIVAQVKEMYPGWTVRVYHDDTIDEKVICLVECARDRYNALYDNADFCNIKEIYLSFTNFANKNVFNADYMHAMKWRW
jgi:hypothetical protein